MEKKQDDKQSKSKQKSDKGNGGLENERASIVKQLLAMGKILMPMRLHSKGGGSFDEGWNEVEYGHFNYDQLIDIGMNLANKLNRYDLVIDVDPRNNGDKSYKKLAKDIGLNLKPTVRTPSKGYHYHLFIPDKWHSFELKKKLPKYPGVDFLSKGQRCQMPTSQFNGKLYELIASDGIFRTTECPQSLFDLLNKGKSDAKKKQIKGKKYLADQVKKILAEADPDWPFCDWIIVGLALYNWDKDKGLEIWAEWSSNSAKYKPGECEKLWAGFTQSETQVTMATIAMWVANERDERLSKAIKEYEAKIKKATAKELKSDIIPALKAEKWDDYDKNMLTGWLVDRHKELKVKQTATVIKKMISCDEEAETETAIPDWCENIIWVNASSQFFDTETSEWLKPSSFNKKYGHEVPGYMNKDGSIRKVSATKYVEDDSLVSVVSEVAYIPWERQLISKLDNKSILNMFVANGIPSPAIKYTNHGIKIFKMICDRIYIMFGKEDGDIMLQWIAWQAQETGKLLRWAPYIQGGQGIGKSLFAELVRACLGDKNVGEVTSKVIKSQFNGYATGKAVNIMDEINIKGTNRHGAATDIKPIITNRLIEIHRKGWDAFTTLNTTNYLFTTNYKDTFVIDSDDRRLWVKWITVDRETVGESYKLFKGIEAYRDQIQKQFLEMEITDEFRRLHEAPMTDEKMSMSATEESAISGLDEIRDLVAKGSKFYCEEFISSFHLFDDLQHIFTDYDINNDRGKSYLLKKFGYMRHPNRMKIDGHLCAIWTKNAMKTDQIRTLITIQQGKMEGKIVDNGKGKARIGIVKTDKLKENGNVDSLGMPE